MKSVFKGVTELYHLAALISIVPGAYQKLFDTNVLGVQNVMQLAVENKIKKVVHVASVEGISYKPGEKDIDESYGLIPDNYFIEYGKTKALGALKALEILNGTSTDLVIVAPGGILGPYDYYVSRIGKLIWDTSRKKLPAYIEGSFDFVDSRDVASLCYLAMKKGKNLESYIGEGSHAYIEDLINITCKHLNVKKPIKVGIRLASVMAVCFEFVYKFFGGQPLLTRGALSMTKVNVTYSGKKAREELGWQPRDLKETVLDTHTWYKKIFDKKI